MLWCAASSEKDLVMGMIQRALSGVDLSGRRLQAARQVQASPGLNGPPVNLSWRKPRSCKYGRKKKNNFIPFFFHSRCCAMIFTPFFLVHAGFPKRTNQVTLQSNRVHLPHSCKCRIERKKKCLIIFFLACACSSFQCCVCCKYELTLYIREKPPFTKTLVFVKVRQEALHCAQVPFHGAAYPLSHLLFPLTVLLLSLWLPLLFTGWLRKLSFPPDRYIDLSSGRRRTPRCPFMSIHLVGHSMWKEKNVSLLVAAVVKVCFSITIFSQGKVIQKWNC